MAGLGCRGLTVLGFRGLVNSEAKGSVKSLSKSVKSGRDDEFGALAFLNSLRGCLVPCRPGECFSTTWEEEPAVIWAGLRRTPGLGLAASTGCTDEVLEQAGSSWGEDLDEEATGITGRVGRLLGPAAPAYDKPLLW